MKNNTITVLSGKWITTKEAATAMNRDIRTVQKLAARGVLKWKPAPGSNARLYDAEDLERYLRGEEAPKPGATGQAIERGAKPTQIETRFGHALETINIVGQMLAAQKAERDTEREQKAAVEAAQLQKLKWEREDAKEHHEAEQKRLEAERLERSAEQRRLEERAHPWITVDTAMAISGRTRLNLLELCRDGKIVAEKAGGWRILRRSLEALDENAERPIALKAKAAGAK